MWLDSHENVMLSAQRALVGRITPEIRMVAVECGDGRAKLWVYHDGRLSPEAEEEFDDATTEVMADVPPDEHPAVGVEFVRVDAPESVAPRGWPVYGRKEVPAVAS